MSCGPCLKQFFFVFKRSKILLCTIELTIPFETADCLITIDLSRRQYEKKRAADAVVCTLQLEDN